MRYWLLMAIAVISIVYWVFIKANNKARPVGWLESDAEGQSQHAVYLSICCMVQDPSTVSHAQISRLLFTMMHQRRSLLLVQL